MDEATRQLQLVRLALSNGLRNCIPWASESFRDRVMADTDLKGVALRTIADELLKWGAAGGLITQAKERNDECKIPFDHLFCVLLPIPIFPRELYVKIGLFDEDEDCPEVMIVSCHLTAFP